MIIDVETFRDDLREPLARRIHARSAAADGGPGTSGEAPAAPPNPPPLVLVGPGGVYSRGYDGFTVGDIVFVISCGVLILAAAFHRW